MRNFKTTLLAATMIAGVSSPAFAQFAFPTVEIDGVGATAPGDINVKVQKCLGVDTQYQNGNTASALSTINSAEYLPSPASAGNPRLLCATDNVDGNVYNGSTTYTGKYIGTGSGFGRQQFVNFDNQFRDVYDYTGAVKKPYGSNLQGTWTNVQYALSETALSVADITDYGTDNTDTVDDTTAGAPAGSKLLDAPGGNPADFDVNAKDAAGPAIQFPLYVVPISFSYDGSYGTKNGAKLFFNVKVPVLVNSIPTGGLRLKRATYCKIWNGDITNWNNAAIKTDNGNQSLADTADSRWDTEGAPIRLIGRVDRSGSTSVFTRALAAQCSQAGFTTSTNKFAQEAESLPFDPTVGAGGPDFTALRADTSYKQGVAASKFAGPINSLGGLVYDKNKVICNITSVTAAVCSAPLANPNTPGLFIVADGSGQVASAIADKTASNLVTSSTAGYVLDGKIGYVGADFTAPTLGRANFSAALQRYSAAGTSATYDMPNATTAGSAIGSILPPQSTATGAYSTADVRQVLQDVTDQSNTTTETVDRTNPLHWVNVLYPPTGVSLAAPTGGYAVTAVSNVLLYTCYNTVAKRSGIANFIGNVLGQITKKAVAGTAAQGAATINLSVNTFSGVAPTSQGILAKSNIATVPTSWKTAIKQTFLSRNTTTPTGTIATALGNLNLWIQSDQALTNVPVTATGAGALKTNFGKVTANPKCATAQSGDGTYPGA